MTKKSTARTIIIIVLCALILVPLIFGLLRLATGGEGALSEFFAKAKLDFWRVEYKDSLDSFTVRGNKLQREEQLRDIANVSSRLDTSYGLFSTMGIAKASCDLLYAKGGVFELGTLIRIMVVLTTILAVGLIVIEIFRFCGKHFNVLENALSHAVLYLSIITTVMSLLFFIGTTCKMLPSDYMGHSMNFTAEIGWYVTTLLPLALSLFIICTKPHEVVTEEE